MISSFFLQIVTVNISISCISFTHTWYTLIPQAVFNYHIDLNYMIIFYEFYWFAFVLCISILQTIKMFENKFHIFILFMISKLSWKKTPIFYWYGSSDMVNREFKHHSKAKTDIAELDRYLKSPVMERLSTSKWSWRTG